jgi:Asp/Glu/hydantoin racemase
VRILVVNPNTTAAMTDRIGRSARATLDRPGVTVEAVNPATGPVSIESHYDEALAVPALLAEVAAGERRVPVLALESDPDAAKTVLAACRAALAADGSAAVVLGCAGMADLARWLTGELGAPVVDGVTAAVLTVHALVTLGLATGSAGEYARPPAKPYTGLLAPWALPPDGLQRQARSAAAVAGSAG